ncbi:MAG: glycosyltransferase family 4 protein [Nitrospiraceae bacterium]|nr:glycosyltransferase family 4 protein [Nitrospiraceae bacterium]
MRVAVLGLRGFPGVQGGVEKHCEELYPRLAKLGCEVTVFTRSPYMENGSKIRYQDGIKFENLWCPKKKSFEAIIHTFLGVIKSGNIRPDILHIHAIGPALLTPMAKVLGHKTVITHHGPDYEREKWGRVAKLILRSGEKSGVYSGDAIIAVSRLIKRTIENKYKKAAVYIPNGVSIPDFVPAGAELKKLQLEAGKYIFTACRFVPEKGLHDLVEAYWKIKNPDFKMVIAGDADHETAYSRNLKKMCSETPGVVLTGYVTGLKKSELFSNAGLFVLPSYYEGLPIALLEALGYNLPVLVSNIPQHGEIALNANSYFQTGNTDDLANKIKQKLSEKKSCRETENASNISLLKLEYNWDTIAEKTLEVYDKVSKSG